MRRWSGCSRSVSRLHSGAAHLEGDALQGFVVAAEQAQAMPARPRRPAPALGGAEHLAVEHPLAALAFEGDALRRRRNVGIDREDAAVARADDAEALLARHFRGRALQAACRAGEENLVAARFL